MLLLIEDDLNLAESMLRVFELRGVPSSHVYCLQQAVQAIQICGKFDTVISDWDLGPYEKLTGAEICTELKKILPDARFVIYSGLEREVPEGIEFYLKNGLGKLLESV